MSLRLLGRLEQVELRTAWLSEAQTFTPWLALPENLAVLSEMLRLALEHDTVEKRSVPSPPTSSAGRLAPIAEW